MANIPGITDFWQWQGIPFYKVGSLPILESRFKTRNWLKCAEVCGGTYKESKNECFSFTVVFKRGLDVKIIWEINTFYFPFIAYKLTVFKSSI